MLESKITKFADLIKKSKRILILLHEDPDGDTIASSLALSITLRATGRKVICASKDEIPKVFEFLPDVDLIQQDFLLGDFDFVITVDCGDMRRTGFAKRLAEMSRSKAIINIDHHTKNDLHKIAKINIVDERAVASSQIIWRIINYLKLELNSKIATCILAGIYYDTGGFQHINVTPESLSIASKCISLGGRIRLISQNISSSKTPQSLMLWGIALKNMRVLKNGIIYSVVTKEDINRCNSKSEDISGLVNLLNTVPSSKIAMLLLEVEDGKIRGSLRTDSDKIDVARFARIFGGGGHKKASGFEVECRLIKNGSSWQLV